MSQESSTEAIVKLVSKLSLSQQEDELVILLTGINSLLNIQSDISCVSDNLPSSHTEEKDKLEKLSAILASDIKALEIKKLLLSLRLKGEK